jgi:ferritin-like metal-binding protein YciE
MNNQNNKPEEVIGHYISDMIGVEKYFCDALEQQLNDQNFKKYPEAIQCVSQLKQMSHQHTEVLKQHLADINGNDVAMSSVKEAISGALGFVKSLYEKVRADAVSKGMRDNYIVSNLCCVGYTMLHTTALACQDSQTAAVALRFLNEYTPAVMKLNEVIPQVVVNELVEQGKIRDASVAPQAIKNSQDAWKSKAAAY